MAASPEGRRGLTPVRLDQIPISIRRRAAQPLLRVAADSADPFGAITITRAIETPSERVYWVPKAAWDRESVKRGWPR